MKKKKLHFFFCKNDKLWIFNHSIAEDNDKFVSENHVSVTSENRFFFAVTFFFSIYIIVRNVQDIFYVPLTYTVEGLLCFEWQMPFLESNFPLITAP